MLAARCLCSVMSKSRRIGIRPSRDDHHRYSAWALGLSLSAGEAAGSMVRPVMHAGPAAIWWLSYMIGRECVFPDVAPPSSTSSEVDERAPGVAGVRQEVGPMRARSA